MNKCNFGLIRKGYIYLFNQQSLMFSYDRFDRCLQILIVHSGILLIDHDVDFCIIGHFLTNRVPQLWPLM